jgi:uncharacterized repeat protein (TIGR03803 family)
MSTCRHVRLRGGSHAGRVTQHRIAIHRLLLSLVLTLSLGASSALAEVRTVYSFAAPQGDELSAPLDTHDGNFYATAASGGAHNRGAVLRLSSTGAVTVLHSFDGSQGARPSSGLTLGANGSLYGTTTEGGSHGFGTAFRISKAGALRTLHSFTLSEGGPVRAPLLRGRDDNFYGVSAGVYQSQGGGFEALSYGAVFRLTPSGAVSVLHSFAGASDGAQPLASLLEGSDGALYGTTSTLQSNAAGRPINISWGTVFRLTTAGAFSTLHTFSGPDGGNPLGKLLQTADGALYGTTGFAVQWQSPGTYGTVFKLVGSTLSTLYRFSAGSVSDGAVPTSGLVAAADGALYGSTSQGGSDGFGTLFRITREGALTTLGSFTAEDGRPGWSLIEGGSGSLIGTGKNTLFRFVLSGALNVLARVGYRDGAAPGGALLLASDGNYYGTTQSGGELGHGGVYRRTPSGALTLLCSFPHAEYAGELIEGSDGALYGAGSGGQRGFGSIFRVSKRGVLTELFSFDETNGGLLNPQLTRGPDGSLYGTIPSGGASYQGTAFRLTRSNVFSIVHTFGSEAYSPSALLLARDGNFYGVSFGGGTSQYAGTVFRLTPAGAFSVLHSFDYEHGSGPDAALIQGSDGALYGTVGSSGSGLGGAVFRVTTEGAFSLLHEFAAPSATEGGFPRQPLVQGRDGHFYGTTEVGGPQGAGTAFRVTAAGVFTNLGGFSTSLPSDPYVYPSALVPAGSAFLGTTQRGGANGAGAIVLVR